jgi:hypothetical protein
LRSASIDLSECSARKSLSFKKSDELETSAMIPGFGLSWDRGRLARLTSRPCEQCRFGPDDAGGTPAVRGKTLNRQALVVAESTILSLRTPLPNQHNLCLGVIALPLPKPFPKLDP